MWGYSTFGTAKFCPPPLFISAATEANNLKFVIQLAFVEQHAKNNF